MIFVTVGSQMPFDRLVSAADRWAAENKSRWPVAAQIGSSSYVPAHMQWRALMAPQDFMVACRTSRVIVGHAGMGTVLTALELSKPLLVMPRRGDLRETRNDHQLATARWLADRPGITVAWDEDELPRALDALLGSPAEALAVRPRVQPALIQALRKFIDRG